MRTSLRIVAVTDCYPTTTHHGEAHTSAQHTRYLRARRDLKNAVCFFFTDLPTHFHWRRRRFRKNRNERWRTHGNIVHETPAARDWYVLNDTIIYILQTGYLYFVNFRVERRNRLCRRVYRKPSHPGPPPGSTRKNDTVAKP